MCLNATLRCFSPVFMSLPHIRRACVRVWGSTSDFEGSYLCRYSNPPMGGRQPNLKKISAQKKVFVLLAPHTFKIAYVPFFRRRRRDVVTLSMHAVHCGNQPLLFCLISVPNLFKNKFRKCNMLSVSFFFPSVCVDAQFRPICGHAYARRAGITLR